MRLNRLLCRAGLLLALWWVLAAADPASLAFGVAAAVAAALCSLRLSPAGRAGFKPWRIVPLLGRFFFHGLRGGLDVSWRAFHPRLPVEPIWMKVRLASDHATANALLGGMMSVLPGSLAAGPADGTMDLHILHGPGFDPLDFEKDQNRVLGLFDRRIKPAETRDA